MYPLKLFFKNPLILWTTAGAIVLNIGLWIVLPLYLRQPNTVFLHYTVFIGVDYVGPWWLVLAMPVLGLTALLANLIIADLLFLKEKIIGYALAVTNIFLHLLLVLAAILVILLNI